MFLELLKKFGILTSERGERAISVEGKRTKAVASSEKVRLRACGQIDLIQRD